jgi:thymidylate kinase
MMFIECFGPVGAGKSTVAKAIDKILLDMGYEVIDLKTAINRGLDRSLLGRLARSIAGPTRRRLLKAFYSYGLYPAYGLRLAITNPALVAAAIQAQLGNGLPWWHKRIIWRLFFNLVIGWAFLNQRLDEGEIVLLEEGPIHRAVNLFAWQMDGLRLDLITQYLEHLPDLGPAVLVDSPLDRCRQRSITRGLPIRLRDKDEVTVTQFFENTANIIALAANYVAGSGRRFFVVDNSGEPGDFELGLDHQLKNKLFSLDGVEIRPVPA